MHISEYCYQMCSVNSVDTIYWEIYEAIPRDSNTL